LLEQKDSQEGIHILHLWEKGKKTKSLRGLKLQKLRRDSTCVCVRRLCRGVQKSKNPLRIQSKSSGGTTFLYAQRSSSKGVRRERKKTKVEAFENLKFFQVWEESAQKLRRSTTVGSAGERDLDRWFHVQEASGEAHRREIDRQIGEKVRLWNRRISFRESRQPLDREKMLRV
jgi:hypothetical protein